MADSPHDLRTCPTRIDGAAALFAHRVSPTACSERQRQGYHKCFTCAYNHAYVAQHGLPVETRPVDLTPEAAPAPRPAPAPEPLSPAAPERAVRVG